MFTVANKSLKAMNDKNSHKHQIFKSQNILKNKQLITSNQVGNTTSLANPTFQSFTVNSEQQIKPQKIEIKISNDASLIKLKPCFQTYSVSSISSKIINNISQNNSLCQAQNKPFCYNTTTTKTANSPNKSKIQDSSNSKINTKNLFSTINVASKNINNSTKTAELPHSNKTSSSVNFTSKSLLRLNEDSSSEINNNELTRSSTGSTISCYTYNKKDIENNIPIKNKGNNNSSNILNNGKLNYEKSFQNVIKSNGDSNTIKNTKEVRNTAIKLPHFRLITPNIKESCLNKNSTTIGLSLNNLNSNSFIDIEKSLNIKRPLLNSFERRRLGKKPKEYKLRSKRLCKEGNFNCGRWQPEEHQRFIEAIMKYGNEWKLVQKYVGSRSSTQARSHAQKFFFKIKRSNLIQLKIDFSKNSIKSLHEMANKLNTDDYCNAVKALNCVAFEKKNTNCVNLNNSCNNNNNNKRKGQKEINNSHGHINGFSCCDSINGTYNYMAYNDENLILNCNENNFFLTNIENRQDKTTQNQFDNLNNTNFTNLRVINNIFDNEENKKSSLNSKNQSLSNIYIKNVCNNSLIKTSATPYNANDYNNTNNYNNDFKNEQPVKKRFRFNSFEDIYPYFEKDPLIPDKIRSLDENEIINNFCKNFQNDEFVGDEQDSIIFYSNTATESFSKCDEYLKRKRIKPDFDNRSIFCNSMEKNSQNKHNFDNKKDEDLFLNF